MAKFCRDGEHKMVHIGETKNKICGVCKRYYIMWLNFENEPKETKESKK